MNPVRIDIVSDPVCPWCYIGRQHLGEALSQLGDIQTQLHWQPFQLFPHLPPAGVDYQTHLAKVFGSARRRDELLAGVKQAGATQGLALNFAGIGVLPNTFPLHRLLWKVGQLGFGDALARAMLAAFFTHNQDLSDPGQLAALLEPFGWPARATGQFLASQDGADQVRGQQRFYRLSGVRSVPTYLFNRRLALVGAQSPGRFQQALRRVAQLEPLSAAG